VNCEPSHSRAAGLKWRRKLHQTAVAKRFRYSRGGIPKILIKAHRICSSLLNPESSAMDSIRKLPIKGLDAVR
jgi:hypothetical protein